MSNNIVSSGDNKTESNDDETNNKGGDGNLEILINVLFMCFLLISIIILMELLLNNEGIKLVKKYPLPFVIISTSIVAGSFFIIKTYIRSEIGIKEVEMGKEFRKDIKEFIAQQKIEFDKQNAKLEQILENTRNENTRTENTRTSTNVDQGNKQSTG